MRTWKVVKWLVYLICLTGDVFGDEGCLVGNVIYTRSIGPVYFLFGNRPQYDPSSAFTLQTLTGGCPTGSQMKFATVTDANPHGVQHCGFTNNFVDNGPGQNTHPYGTSVLYSVINCPLDNFLLVFFSIVTFAFYRLRKTPQS